MMRYGLVVLFLVLVGVLSSAPFAQEVSGNFQQGSVKVGMDTATCDAARDGAIRFDSSSDEWEFCNGSAWLPFEQAAGSGGFTGFTDLIDQTLSTLVASNILQVIIPGTNTISISGDGSPQYRICSTSNCSTEVQTWGSLDGSVSAGEFVQLRLTTSNSYGTSFSATVSVGTTTDQWDVTTQEDTTPDPFSFTMALNQTGSSQIQSNIVLITSITIPVSVSVSGGGSPQFRTCSDAACSTEIQTWTSAPTSISNNQYLQLRATTPASGTITVAATAGDGSSDWYASTNGKGYFVLASSSSTGSLGGRSGANTTCVNNLTSGTWLEKASATIDAAHVFSFLCDGSGCNNLQPNTIYQFARSGSATAGGAIFITDSSGRGPGSTGRWDTVTTFNTTTRFWSNRATGSSTLWGTTGQANHCNNWSDGTAGFSGVRGDPTETGDRRWDDGADACSSSRSLVCFVNP